MKNLFFPVTIFCFFFASCQKEQITIGENVQDLFYVENKGAKMAVLVEGNTASKIIVLLVHGGPGGTAIGFNNDDNITNYLESKYAVAFWEQRAAGISQGNGKLQLSLYIEDMEKIIAVLKQRYGADSKVFLLSHSWGGLIAPGYLTEGTGANQNSVKGWINVAGAHNYYLNDSLTRAYLLSFGKEQIRKNIYKTQWDEIVSFAEANIPDYDYKLSSEYAKCAFDAEAYVDSIKNPIGGGPAGLFKKRFPFAPFWMLSNVGATVTSNLGNEIIRAQYSDKLPLITLPVLCITGKYDFTVPAGMADEVMKKIASVKKRLVILQLSGHICMDNEPDNFYKEVIRFIEENK
jgi:pimeloyl-ACP methyl ester carboxylesterase